MKILFSSAVRGATVPTREKRGDRIERRIVSGVSSVGSIVGGKGKGLVCLASRLMRADNGDDYFITLSVR